MKDAGEAVATDHELLDAWCAGDREAGDALIRRHFEAVCRFFRGKLGDDIEDLVIAGPRGRRMRRATKIVRRLRTAPEITQVCTRRP